MGDWGSAFPKNKTKTGIIFEFKKVNKRKNETPEEAATRAREQIKKRNYRKKLESHGVTDIIEIAISFKGNEVLVLY